MKTIVANNTVYNSLAAACREYNFSYNAVYDRVIKGETPQQAFDHYINNAPKAATVFTDAEIDIMKQMAESGLSSTAAAKKLGRPVRSVRKKAGELGISFHSVRKLTEEEVEFIKNNIGKKTYKAIAGELCVDIRTVQYHSRRLGLTKPRKKEPKTTLDIIKQYSGKLCDREIARLATTSTARIQNLAYENNISLACPERSGRRPWTSEEDGILKQYYLIEGYKALSKRLGTRTPGTVRTRLKVLGLR